MTTPADLRTFCTSGLPHYASVQIVRCRTPPEAPARLQATEMIRDSDKTSFSISSSVPRQVMSRKDPNHPGDSRAEPLSILTGENECLDHLSLLKVAPKLIELGKPELIAGIARVGRVCRVAPEVSEVLHQHERRVELGLAERGRICD